MDMTLYIGLAVIAFVMGLLVGSFLNVAIYRVPLGLSVGDPVRSFCFRCGSRIAWFDNIPVLSYLALGGRDRACGSQYGWRYALVELLTGGLFLWLFLVWNSPTPGGFSPASIWYMAFVSVLIVGTFTDLDHWIMPRGLTTWGTAAGLLAALVLGFVDRDCLVGISGPFPVVREYHHHWLDGMIAVLAAGATPPVDPSTMYWWEPVANAAIGAIAAPLLLLAIGKLGALVFRREAMGLGDVDLFMLIGATLGAVNSLYVLILASFIGTIGGTALIIHGRLKRAPDSPLALGAKMAAEPIPAAPRVASPNAQAPASGEDDEETMAARSFAESLELDFVDLTAERATPEALAAVGDELRAAHSMWPLAMVDGRLRVACADPLNSRLVAALREAGHTDVDFAIARPSQIAAAIEGRLATTQATADPGAPSAEAGDPLWRRFVVADSALALPAQLHMLPFIPWITLGCLVVLLGWPWVSWFIGWLLFRN